MHFTLGMEKKDKKGFQNWPRNDLKLLKLVKNWYFLTKKCSKFKINDVKKKLTHHMQKMRPTFAKSVHGKVFKKGRKIALKFLAHPVKL